MIQNFFRIAVRNILQHKGFTFINVTGLAVGLAASLLILLWIQDEFSYDKLNLNAENIYRVEEDQFYSGERYHVTVTPHPSGPVWKERIPEIKEQTRLNRLPRILFRQEDKLFFESAIVAADSGIFRMFTLPLLLGDPLTTLNSPYSIVLTEKLALKYFGETDPLGKTITLENKYAFIVTGVMKDLPKNSILTFEGVIPYSFLCETGRVNDSWGNNSIFTFVMLEGTADITTVNKKLTDIVLENNPQTTTKFVLFPLLDIHLHSQFGYTQTKGPVIAIYTFTLIAIFILLIACMNFINLSTAKAPSRGKEIGIKKVAGADQMSMIVQFMFESFLLVAMALVLALIMIGLLLGAFNNISGKSFSLSDLFQWKFIFSLIIVGLIAGFVSGIYPALYLSSIRPITVLRGETVSGKGNGRLRQILVVVQFTSSMLIAIAAIFMYMQLKFLREKDLGFDKDNLICITMPEGIKPRYNSLKSELKKETLIQDVTASRSNPVMIGSNSSGATWEGKDPEKLVLIGTNTVDYDYIKTMKMELVSGRDFSQDFPSDIARDTTGNFLINEEVAKIMGKGDQVGKTFRFMGLSGRIVGVLKNFNFKSADQPIEPIAFALTDSRYLNYILVKLTPGDIPSSLKTVERVWKEILPEYPLDYTFIDQDYDRLFRSQMRITGLLKYFTILAVIISCLGLYGLSSYSVEHRTKEVGIRKVLGADSLTVIYTLSREYLFLILISIIIAVPVGWIIVVNFLKQYAVRIDMNPIVFTIIALGAIIIAMLTVSFQAYKATVINPAETLKIE
ncbi:MAG: ABC transporter permease [Bacteroidales bacterium]|nr:ABC transporter permease [Bacteroidales bacterium]